MTIQQPESEAKIAAMFNRIAPRYDLLNRLLSAHQDQRWRKALVKMIPYRPGGRYLDMATGTGDVLLAAARSHPEYASFLGGDISSEMLSLASDKAKHSRTRGRVQPLEFKIMSAESVTLPESSVDCISIAFGLRNVVNKEVAIQQFARVLRPGGALLILEFFLPERGLLARLFQFYFHSVLPTIGGLISDRDAYRYLPESVGSFYSPEALRSVIYKNGLTVSDEVNFLFGAARIVKAIKP
jgi:demethylmenaquinone methyltransferase/2-methoxy-6-polyprenyl-1,4-benzoquinol methylase